MNSDILKHLKHITETMKNLATKEDLNRLEKEVIDVKKIVQKIDQQQGDLTESVDSKKADKETIERLDERVTKLEQHIF